MTLHPEIIAALLFVKAQILAGVKYIAIAFAYTVWEYWLGKTKKIAAGSTLELFLMLAQKLFKREKEKIVMEKEIVKTEVVDVDVELDAGFATISVAAVAPGDIGVEGGAFVKVEAEKLIRALAKEIAKKLPPAALPMVEVVVGIVIQAVKLVK